MKDPKVRYFLFIILILLFLFITIVIGFIIKAKNSSTSSTVVTVIPTPTSIPISYSPTEPSVVTPSNGSISSLTPNKSTLNDVKQNLGDPVNTTTQGEFQILEYPANNTNRTNKIYIKNNTVTYIVEEITTDNTLYKDYLDSTHHNDDGILYDSANANAGFAWHIFSTDGIAFLASTYNGYTIEVQHFPPMTYQAYLDSFAKTLNLSQTPPEGN